MRNVILVTGPESSGTRWIAGLLSQHPEITGTEGGHEDPLDRFWNRQTDEIPEGLILTRRSLPAGSNGRPARYMRFEDFGRLRSACDSLTTIVTVRSPLANIVAQAKSRKSPGGSFERARSQYMAAYRHLRALDGPFYLLSLEAVVLDGPEAINGIFALLGLSPHAVEIEPKRGVNERRYAAARGD